MSETNPMGLDKFQMTIIKSNYTALKPFITKKNKLDQKAADFKKKIADKVKEFEEGIAAELKSYEAQIAALDNITASYTKSACGLELTTQQVMDFTNNPEKFEEYKKSIGMGNDLFNQKEPLDLGNQEYPVVAEYDDMPEDHPEEVYEN